MTPEQLARLDGVIQERQATQDLANLLADHLRRSDIPEARVWGDAIEWFRQRTKGGQLSIHAQRDFDARFGQLDRRDSDTVTAYDPDTGSVVTVGYRRGDGYLCAGCDDMLTTRAALDGHVQDCPQIRR
ncbi:hypothetical protein [Nonomuraea typhae]|uniref:C2H2-type domain-containing protein n=1 Tax=Nonomuraea typhae TaxID=2603600 RepID=A0ABW7YLV1_9ACTN